MYEPVSNSLILQLVGMIVLLWIMIFNANRYSLLFNNILYVIYNVDDIAQIGTTGIPIFAVRGISVWMAGYYAVLSRPGTSQKDRD